MKSACGINVQDVEVLQIKRLSSANSINAISDTKTTNDVNTTHRIIMLDKLTSLGLNRSAVQWFRSYLTMRTQSVCTNGVLSEPQPISFGVPQGSVLGSLLFIIYINDLPLAVQGCCVELYADDTLIYFASKSVSEIQGFKGHHLLMPCFVYRLH